jgi:tRNA U34 5-methylaminomethyl-2-thiouridine-forming methyltransferase MnmC
MIVDDLNHPFHAQLRKQLWIVPPPRRRASSLPFVALWRLAAETFYRDVLLRSHVDSCFTLPVSWKKVRELFAFVQNLGTKPHALKHPVLLFEKL